MDLLRRDEGYRTKPGGCSNFPMNAVQPRKRLHLIKRHFNAGDTQGETVRQIGQRAECRKIFSGKLTCAHLPEVVVVVRVRVVVWTGCLSPA